MQLPASVLSTDSTVPLTTPVSARDKAKNLEWLDLAADVSSTVCSVDFSPSLHY
jgi:hypothetical protein